VRFQAALHLGKIHRVMMFMDLHEFRPQSVIWGRSSHADGPKSRCWQTVHCALGVAALISAWSLVHKSRPSRVRRILSRAPTRNFNASVTSTDAAKLTAVFRMPAVSAGGHHAGWRLGKRQCQARGLSRQDIHGRRIGSDGRGVDSTAGPARRRNRSTGAGLEIVCGVQQNVSLAEQAMERWMAPDRPRAREPRSGC